MTQTGADDQSCILVTSIHLPEAYTGLWLVLLKDNFCMKLQFLSGACMQ